MAHLRTARRGLGQGLTLVCAPAGSGKTVLLADWPRRGPSAALTPNAPAFQPGFEGADTSVTAAVSLYGYYGAVTRLRACPHLLWPMSVRDVPPFFVAHGEQDTMAPVDGARLFVERLRSTSSNPVVYAELPGAQHTADLFHSLRLEAVIDGIEPSPPG